MHSGPLVYTAIMIFRVAQYTGSQDSTRYTSDIGAAQSSDTASVCPVCAIVGGVGRMDIAVISCSSSS